MTTLKLKLAHGTTLHELTVPAESSFEDLKAAAAKVTGVPVGDQKLLFRGRERGDGDAIYAAGVKDGGKIMLIESEARRAEAAARQAQTAEEKSKEAQAKARLDALSKKVDEVEAQIKQSASTEGTSKHWVGLGEVLTKQLLELDSVEAPGETRSIRRALVVRVQALCDQVDKIKSDVAVLSQL